MLLLIKYLLVNFTLNTHKSLIYKAFLAKFILHYVDFTFSQIIYKNKLNITVLWYIAQFIFRYYCSFIPSQPTINKTLK